MDNRHISLAIFGNQNSNSGFQPLYWINTPPQQLENLVPPGMEDNPYFFVLETYATHTLFTLVQNHVSSFMSSRPGALKMAIALPKGYRIAGPEGPMEVLLKVRTLFMEQCMTHSMGDSYQFTERLADAAIFEQLLNNYTLEPDNAAQQPMTGQNDALLLLTSEQTSQLFLDCQRQEFTHYRRIIIGEKGKASVYPNIIRGLQIPRPRPVTQPAAPSAPPRSSTPPTSSPTPSPSQKPSSPQSASTKPGYLRYVWVPVVTFILGVLLGWWIASSNTDTTVDEEEEDPVETNILPNPLDNHIDEQREDPSEDRPEDDAPQGFSNQLLITYQGLLESAVGLTFDQVDKMYEWISDEEVASACNAADRQFVSRVNGYKAIVDFLRAGDIEAAKSKENETHAMGRNSSGKDNIHLMQMRAAYRSWVDDEGVEHRYSPEEAAEALKLFQMKAHDGLINSFADINNIHNEIGQTIHITDQRNGGSNPNPGNRHHQQNGGGSPLPER